MDRATYEAALLRCWHFSILIRDEPIEEMITAAEHALAVGALIDPTLYMKNAAKLEEDVKMLRAVGAVKAALVEMRDRVQGFVKG